MLRPHPHWDPWRGRSCEALSCTRPASADVQMSPTRWPSHPAVSGSTAGCIRSSQFMAPETSPRLRTTQLSYDLHDFGSQTGLQ